MHDFLDELLNGNAFGGFSMSGVPQEKRGMVRGAVQAAHKDTTRTRDQKASRIAELFHVDREAILKLV